MQRAYLGMPLGATPVEGMSGKQELAQGEVKLQFSQPQPPSTTWRAPGLEWHLGIVPKKAKTTGPLYYRTD